MKTSTRCYFTFRFIVLFSALSVVLHACAPMSLPSEQTAATPAVALPVATQSELDGYPGPGETEVSPTVQPLPRPIGIVTPPPDEKVAVGMMSAGRAIEKALPYTARLEYTTEPRVNFWITIEYQGKEIRLGDENGDSNLEATTDGYLTWTYKGDGLKPQEFADGLYFYELSTGKNTLVASGQKVGFSRAEGDWILYVSWEGPQPTVDQLRMDDTPSDITTPLLAYNIPSGKTFTLTDKLPIIRGRFTRSWYGVNGVQAAWIEYDAKSGTYAIKLAELNTGEIETLPVKAEQPRFISLSSDLVVWRDIYWRGYSLTQKAFFTIPYSPKEWENVAGNMVVAKDGAVEWSISNTPDGARYYFTAPVFVK